MEDIEDMLLNDTNEPVVRKIKKRVKIRKGKKANKNK